MEISRSSPPEPLASVSNSAPHSPGELDSTSPPSSATGKAGRFYQPGLDVLRCLAFFLVFTHHVFPKTPTGSFSVRDAFQEFGSAGVCLFFTLSSFLITELLLREREGTGTIHMRAFYVRRILRIWPLYLSVLAFGVIFPHFYHRFTSGEGLILPYLLMCGNWALILQDDAMRNTLLGPLWSISVEEQFYVLWPMLFLLWRKRGLVAAMCVMLPVAWATDYVLTALHYTVHTALWYNTLNQFQFFALGGGLAIVTHRRQFKLAFPVRLLAFATAFGFLTLAAFPFHFQSRSGASTPGQVLSGYLSIDVACLLLVCAFLNARISPRFQPLVYLGKISYGLYVFHLFILDAVVHVIETKLHLSQPIEVAVDWTVTAAIVIPLASLSYQYFEKPFLRFKDRFTFVPSRSA